MKRKIDVDEWYPVYSLRGLDSYGGHEIEVTEDQVAHWESAAEVFAKAQDEMGELHGAAEQVARERALVEKAAREAADKADRLERQRRIEEKNRKYRAAVAKAVGTVYEVDGKPVGEISEESMGLRVKLIIDT